MNAVPNEQSRHMHRVNQIKMVIKPAVLWLYLANFSVKSNSKQVLLKSFSRIFPWNQIKSKFCFIINLTNFCVKSYSSKASFVNHFYEFLIFPWKQFQSKFCFIINLTNFPWNQNQCKQDLLFIFTNFFREINLYASCLTQAISREMISREIGQITFKQ